MSTLTKILVVLLAAASLFLCGIVVTYVATTSNYKNAYDDLKEDMKLLKTNYAGVQEQLSDSIHKMENLSDRLNSSINSLTAEKQKLEQELKTTKAGRNDLEKRVSNLAAAALKFEETVSGMENSLKATRAQLDRSRAEEIKLNKDLGEVTVALTEKVAQLDAMGIEQKRLLEGKDKLERQLAGQLPGKSITELPITQTKNSAKQVQVPSDEVPLQGLITAVDELFVTISIGAADGVVKGMVFHVIRDDAADPFVCDILISDVDSEAAAGTMQVVQSQPRIGDMASTTW